MVLAALSSLVLSGFAAAQTDQSGTWRTWHTAHFRVHARAELAGLAVRAAREAERAYGLYAAELPEPAGPIELTLQDNLDVSNGFATPFPTNRINIFAPAPSGLIDIGYFDDWLRVVITHELAHVFHLDYSAGGWRVLRKIFGRSPFLFPAGYQPSWVREGIATYYESRFTGAGRIKGTYLSQAVAAAAGGSSWLDPADAWQAGPGWPAGLRPYAWGSRFFQLQSETHGDSVIPGFIRAAGGNLWPFATSAPLVAAGGSPVGVGWTAMRRRYAALPNGSAGERMDTGLRLEPGLDMAPDRRSIAYLRSDGRTPVELVVVDVASGSTVAARDVNGRVDFQWVGDSLFVTQLDFTTPVDLRMDLYRWIPGRSWTRLTRNARLEAPFDLPGPRVGAVDLGAGTSSLVALEPPGYGHRTPLEAPAALAWNGIELSPDGRWLAGTRNYAGQWDVVMWPVARPSESVPITDDAAFDGDPVWNHTGDVLYFHSERDGLPQIFAADLRSRDVTRVTAEPTGAREPVIAADGSLWYSTVLADGFAVVRSETPGPPVASGSLPSVTSPSSSPIVAAPDVPIRESGYNPWPTLRPRFWFPFARGEGSTGTFVGALTSGNDPIGRVGYGASVAVAPGRGRWEASLGFTYDRWKAWSVDMGARQTWDLSGRLRLEDGSLVSISERERLITTGVSWRSRRWRTGVGLRLGAELEHEVFVSERPLPPDVSLRRAWFGGVVASASASRTVRPPMAISREDGVTVGALVRRRWRLSGAGVSHELRGNVNAYLGLPLPGFARWVLAARVTAGVSGGDLPSTFSLGGESGDPLELIPGFAFGRGRRSFPLRGYPRDIGRFTRAVVGVAELRVPVIAINRGIWKLPFGLDRISLTGFAETGGGWLAGEPAVPTDLWDVGFEGVVDLTIVHDVPLRMRVGAAVPLVAGFGVARGRWRYYLTFGESF